MLETSTLPTASRVRPGFSSGCLVACVPSLMPRISTVRAALFGVNLRPSDPVSVKVTEISAPGTCAGAAGWVGGAGCAGAAPPLLNWHVTGRLWALMVTCQSPARRAARCAETQLLLRC